MATTAGHVYTIDSSLNYMVTRSMGRHGTLEIPKFMMTVEGKGGRHYSKLGIGQSIAGLPFFWLGSLVERVSPDNPATRAYSRSFRIPHESNAITAEPQTLIRLSDREGAPLFFVTLTNAFVAAWVCLVFWLILRRFDVSEGWALLGTALLAFATPLWIYARDLFGEPLFTASLLSTLYLLKSPEEASHNRLMLGGLATSMGMLTRVSFVPLAGLFAAYLVLASEDKRRGFERALRYAGFCLPGIVTLALLNQVRFGSVLTTGYHTAFDKGFSVPFAKGLVWNLASPYRSLFLYAPAVVLCFFGLRAFARKHRADLLLIVAIAAYVFVVYSGWWAWHGGWCWGPRFLVPIIPLLLIPGFVAVSRRGGWLAGFAIALGAAGFTVQLGAILVNYTAPYDYWIKIGALDWAEKNIQMFSPITTHWKAVLATRPVDYDLWIVQLFKVSKPAGITIAAGLGIGAAALGWAIRKNRNRRE
jgi:MFS family permease